MVDESSPTFYLSDAETILRQFSKSPSPNQAASTSQCRVDSTPVVLSSALLSASTSWFFDLGCYNHMTSESGVFASTNVFGKASVFHKADSSELKASHINKISSPKLSLGDAFLIVRLTLNLKSVNQFCELGLMVHFADDGGSIQEPQTGWIIGTSLIVGHLFELISLEVLSSSITRCVATVSKELWHSRLGHVSNSRLCSLVSSEILGHIEVLLMIVKLASYLNFTFCHFIIVKFRVILRCYD